MLVVAFGVLGLSYVATYGLVRRALQDNALSGLQKRATELRDIAQDTSVAALPRQRLQLALRITDIRVVLVRPNGVVVDSELAGTTGLPEPLTVAGHPPRTTQCGRTGERTARQRGLPRGPDRDGCARGGRFVVVATDTVDISVLRKLFPLLLLAGLVVLGLAFAVAAWLARRLTRPIGEIERAARKLATGDLSARADVASSTDDELAALASTLNDMAAQLEHARGSERAFLLSISHDLRTPLTSIRGYAEALADGTLDDADPDDRKRGGGGDRRRGAPVRSGWCATCSTSRASTSPVLAQPRGRATRPK